MSEWLDLLGALFLLGGAALALVAAIALVRFPDLLSKMHAITKPQVLGLLLIATGLALTFRTWSVFILCTLIVTLQLITSPVSATMVSRSAYRTGLMESDIMVMDELSEELSRAGYTYADREDDDDQLETEPFADDEEPHPERPDLVLDEVSEPKLESPASPDVPLFEPEPGQDTGREDGTARPRD